MNRGMLILGGVVVALSVGVGQAFAAVSSHAAPAPLLAAGIPAFVALGGGTLVSRLLRRRKAASSATTIPQT